VNKSLAPLISRCELRRALYGRHISQSGWQVARYVKETSKKLVGGQRRQASVAVFFESRRDTHYFVGSQAITKFGN
jgi:hypothetical protein